MELTVKYMTENDCYKVGRKIAVQGIMVHSTSTPGVMAAQWFKAWNKPGIQKCVHAFSDDREVWQYLPWNYRGWHAGASANDTHVAFEICEPNNLNDAEYFNRAYKNAVELTVLLCKQFKLTEKNVICHCEGFKLGIASNHGDVMHWFPKHNKDMDTFREDVRIGLLPPKYYVQTGTFNEVETAQNTLNKYFNGLYAEVKQQEKYYIESGTFNEFETAQKIVDAMSKEGLWAEVVKI
jgi:N-acetyl-anhydromuramyl-L-alanine amidase AmpD